MKYKVICLRTNSDIRGALTSVEGLQDIPIDIKRIFYMHHVTEDRGGHAHKDTDQVVIPVSGTFKIRLFDGKESMVFEMCDCTKALYIPRLTFTDLYDFSPDAVCLVLANTHYDMGRSLRSKEEYISYLNEMNLL